MVEQVFIREEAMVRGWSEADLWGWAAVSSRLESILLYPLEGNFHSKLAVLILSFFFINASIDLENQNKCYFLILQFEG